MLEGLQILIARMETNPDEFIDGEWDYFLEDNPVISDIFTEEEKESFKEARVRLTEFKRQRHRQRFTEQVIQRLFDRDNPEIPRPQNYRERIKLSKNQAIVEMEQRKALEEYVKKYMEEKAI